VRAERDDERIDYPAPEPPPDAKRTNVSLQAGVHELECTVVLRGDTRSFMWISVAPHPAEEDLARLLEGFRADAARHGVTLDED